MADDKGGTVDPARDEKLRSVEQCGTVKLCHTCDGFGYLTGYGLPSEPAPCPDCDGPLPRTSRQP